MICDNELILNIESSLLKFCNDVIAKHQLESFQNFNFDAHSSINTLPEKDLLGIAELASTNFGELHSISVKFIVCTNNSDTNLSRLRNLISILYGTLQPGNHDVKLVDNNNGRCKGNFVVEEGVYVMPVGRTKGRPLQAMVVQLGLSQRQPPS